ncbi:hypothetical protein JCM19294_2716 [Nonlabens tegetincola]|uniref:Uncharacterized protein n=1 Tax=Nonlabens tegetincola TaxID=323273 RepID=A0A090PYK0_9FLAO|nr:hypothetical protein JCM19294_2716 [Nonlabens tegetincola]
MAYNVIEQQVQTPIICNGFTLLEGGELAYFRTEDEQTKHHMMQIWQTPFLKGDVLPSEHQDTLLFKIGNKDIVKAMAESNELITLLNKEDSYEGLYDDIARASKDVIDAYYWLNEEETQQLSIPLKEINKAANAAVDEFEKVKQLRKQAAKETQSISKKSEELFNKIKSTSFKSIQDFVHLLTQLRTLRGEVISLNEIRYTDDAFIEEKEQQIVEQNELISRRAVTFLLQDTALSPYHQAVEEKQEQLEKVDKVIDIKQLEKEVNQIAEDLELLIDIVSNLKIEDTSHSTKIIENISLIFATINQLKAALKNKIKAVGKKEAQADFAAQLKLVDQSIINYLDIADTPEKCDEFLTKISITLEELEGKFADFDEYITTIIEKREEVYAAFDSRKNSLVEARNKKAISLQNAANRIIKGAQKRAQSLASTVEINGYFASDLMINKVRDIIKQLQELDDAGKAESLETALKSSREDALRKLKDKQELYEDGENIIKLGQHKFGVNKQQLDLTIVYKNDSLYYHLTGTDFYQKLNNEILEQSRSLWDQELVSENHDVYRSSYLAYTIFQSQDTEQLAQSSEADLLQQVQQIASQNYAGGYVKGVHDHDAAAILNVLVQKHHDLELLRFTPNVRAHAQLFWQQLDQEIKNKYNQIIKRAGHVLQVFPNSDNHIFVIDQLIIEITNSNQTAITIIEKQSDFNEHIKQMATYLFYELKDNDHFVVSQNAIDLQNSFEKALQSQNAYTQFNRALDECDTQKDKVDTVRHWVSAFAKAEQPQSLQYHIEECVAHMLYGSSAEVVNSINATQTITNLKGTHSTITDGEFEFNYHRFVALLDDYVKYKVPAYEMFKKTKHQVTEDLKSQLRLEEFKPRVLSSFVRNKLINQVYFPLIGDNLSKQLGTVGDSKRTDRMGMLLLISPPGYGKTTLMEYVANRLGLIFMKLMDQR